MFTHKFQNRQTPFYIRSYVIIVFSNYNNKYPAYSRRYGLKKVECTHTLPRSREGRDVILEGRSTKVMHIKAVCKRKIDQHGNQAHTEAPTNPKPCNQIVVYVSEPNFSFQNN